jgi:hypothetical protein
VPVSSAAIKKLSLKTGFDGIVSPPFRTLYILSTNVTVGWKGRMKWVDGRPVDRVTIERLANLSEKFPGYI